MELNQLLEIVSRGEDSLTQFKENITNQDSLAAEMVAFSNSKGGKILIGIKDDGEIGGLKAADIRRINQMISNAASQSIRPAINPLTENFDHENGLIVVLSIAEGVSKPYMDKNGVIWVKSGSDKRKATSREEIQRIYQVSGLIHADETPVNTLTIDDIDQIYFKEFFEKVYEESIEMDLSSLERLLNNMNLAKGKNLNIAGALLFAKRPQFAMPLFIVKAICYPGADIHTHEYIDSRDIAGKLSDVFQTGMSFLLANIKQIQMSQSVNSIGEFEVPKIVFEELLANALIHRDYFVPAPIRIFVFSDRIEIISPGHLPNHLTIENIIAGNSNIRNPVLASFATKLLPYRGLGNGIRRAVKVYPNIDFIDDREGNQFTAIIRRINNPSV
ncbi:RNA-binding domain-containing protein [Acidaminobacter hydrogenoformans]|uniref:ATP-dependent DNA helicase RecG n=1 Tax=Acidaminobacter hydrogenoformans DSM 2784 TaxID=1120920 RepID=A0A1G5RQP8_9FIRM|nr:RNA-binding domain-containing protein [Acidaminobacter hydrogenoformans]SCZ76327.1 ATP-dependent DNA helicase RecG [Acidaminobacter hydrogenoformans DSM 2784]